MYEYKAKILDWVDGDTLVLEIDLGFFCKREERVRLARVAADELKSSVIRERNRAKSARAVGKKICPIGSEVIVQTQKNKRDMYARYIAEVIFKGKNLSDYLIEKKVVKKFEKEKL